MTVKDVHPAEGDAHSAGEPEDEGVITNAEFDRLKEKALA